MTTNATRTHPTNNPSTTRRTSAAWIAGGVAWIAAGLLFADDGWRFTAASATWLVADILLIGALVGLLQLRPHGERPAGSVALRVAIVARFLFAAGEVVSIATGSDEGPLIPLAALLTAVSFTTYAIVVTRANRSTGPIRWSLLAIGVYPFVAMFPVLAVTGEPNYLLISLWGVPAVLVGLSLRGGRTHG